MIVKSKSELPNGYQQLTVSTAVVSLTIPTGSNVAVIVVETDDIRYRDDGTNPTSTIGTPVVADQSLAVAGAIALSKIKFIRSGSVDAVLNINYYIQ